MNDGMLHDILDIERQIEADLAAERRRAGAWLALRKKEIDHRCGEQLEVAATTACRDGEKRCQAVRAAGAARIRDMRRQARRLKTLSDGILRQVVQRHLPQIIGGVPDDHPDGQN